MDILLWILVSLVVLFILFLVWGFYLQKTGKVPQRKEADEALNRLLDEHLSRTTNSAETDDYERPQEGYKTLTREDDDEEDDDEEELPKRTSGKYVQVIFFGDEDYNIYARTGVPPEGYEYCFAVGKNEKLNIGDVITGESRDDYFHDMYVSGFEKSYDKPKRLRISSHKVRYGRELVDKDLLPAAKKLYTSTFHDFKDKKIGVDNGSLRIPRSFYEYLIEDSAGTNMAQSGKTMNYFITGSKEHGSRYRTVKKLIAEGAPITILTEEEIWSLLGL